MKFSKNFNIMNNIITEAEKINFIYLFYKLVYYILSYQNHKWYFYILIINKFVSQNLWFSKIDVRFINLSD